MDKKLSKLHEKAVSTIKEFMGKLCTKSIDTSSIFCDETPIIHEDKYSDANTYTLSRIVLNDDGRLYFESDSAYRDCRDMEGELSANVLVDVVRWLKEYEDELYEAYSACGIVATTAKGTKVCLCFVDDCEDNTGGYFVEVYFYPGDGDRYDYFCIHKEDCDCEDMNAVEEFARKYISEITDY